jgi:UDP-2,4-diacetamido-2,4,6-trideoxy-beta-L-altropyranose hydrolase
MRALFRCDAGADIGAGHVTRCLALAEILADRGWDVMFAVRPQTIETMPAVTRDPRIEVRAIDVAPEQEPQSLFRLSGGDCDLLTVDHYGRDAMFESACRTFAKAILVLDDGTGRMHDCDALVDAAASGPEAYASHVPAGTRVLTGPAYAILRRAFVERRPSSLARRDGRPVDEILVMFGATDPCDATSVALDVLGGAAGDARISVILSSKARHLASVRRRETDRVRVMVDVDDMAGAMADADLAIGAPGVSAYERAVLGLPAVQVTVAQNQRGIADLMLAAGAAADAGTLDEGTASRLRTLITAMMNDRGLRMRTARAAADLVDGNGPARVIEAIT